MSTQRKMRAELHQGLHQFLMQLYFSYTETMNKEGALEQILSAIKEQHEYFSGQQSLGTSSTELLTLAKELESKASNSDTYEEQMMYYEQAETLKQAHEIIQRKGENN